MQNEDTVSTFYLHKLRKYSAYDVHAYLRHKYDCRPILATIWIGYTMLVGRVYVVLRSRMCRVKST